MDERIVFNTEDNEQVAFYVLEHTTLNGNLYLLVTEDDDADEAEVYIMKQTGENDSDEVTYEIVDDETELAAVASVFDVLLDEADTLSMED